MVFVFVWLCIVLDTFIWFMFIFVFFFFKQKTAYEMRISDWSSDVCSSDLYDWGSPGRRAFSVSLHNTPHRLRTRGAFFVGDSVKNRHSCWRFQRVSQCAAMRPA